MTEPFSVTVVIATRNRPELLRRALAAIGDQTVPVHETLVVFDQSDPDEGRWVWAYRVVIRNEGEATARLVSRHWEITDGNGRVQTVDGPGVVGQTPRLGPGDSFEYHSGCPLSTPGGVMAGHYTMHGDDGSMRNILIPTFSLDLPEPRTLN